MWCSLTAEQKQEFLQEVEQIALEPTPRAFYLGDTKLNTPNQWVENCGDDRNSNDFYQNKEILEYIGKRTLAQNLYYSQYLESQPGWMQYFKSRTYPFWIDNFTKYYLTELPAVNERLGITIDVEMRHFDDNDWVIPRNMRVDGFAIMYLRGATYYNIVAQKVSSMDRVLMNFVTTPNPSQNDWDIVLKALPSYNGYYESDNLDPIPPSLLPFNELNRRQLEREVVIATAQEWKIHLQVDPQYLYWALYRVLPFVAKTPEIRAVKVALSYENSLPDTGALPIIVLYMWTSEHIDQVVSDLTAIFPDTLGISYPVTPRHNYKVNNVVYYAQGQGMYKEQLKSVGLLDHYFNAATNYAFLRPYTF